MNQITRFSAPTRFDTLPYKTIWIHDLDGKQQFYIQCSSDLSKPQWESLGYVLVNAFKDALFDEKFIDECITLYKKER